MRTNELARDMNNGYGVLDEMIIYRKYLTEVVDGKVNWHSKGCEPLFRTSISFTQTKLASSSTENNLQLVPRGNPSKTHSNCRGMRRTLC